MPTASQFDAWSAGQSYEAYMGRWSRALAPAFLDWLGAPSGADWIEVGCGTGALTAAIVADAAPRSVLAIDASESFVAHARAAITDPRVRFAVADAARLPAEDGGFDFAASALVLNFLPDRIAALREMQRVLRPGGRVGFYVWDYPGGGMEMMRVFWTVATELDEKARDLVETQRFAFCTADGVAALCAEAGLLDTTVAPIEVDTVFESFDDYWHPFTLGTGPAPGYVASLAPAAREALRSALAVRLGAGAPIRMTARAWAAMGARP